MRYITRLGYREPPAAPNRNWVENGAHTHPRWERFIDGVEHCGRHLVFKRIATPSN